MTSVTDTGRSARDVTVHLRQESLAHDLLVLRASVAERTLRGGGSIMVDVSAVQRLSSEVVHVLLWARRTCSRRGVPIGVEGAGVRATSVLSRCGLDQAPREERS